MRQIVKWSAIALVVGGSLIVAVTELSPQFWIHLLQPFSSDGVIENPEYVRERLRDTLTLVILTGLWIWGASKSVSFPLTMSAPDRYRALNLFALILCYGFYLHRYGVADLPFLFGKEQLLEVLGAALFFASAGFLAYTVYKFRKDRQLPTKPYEEVLAVFVATGCFFVGMEEISWGQSYSSFTGLDWLIAANVQNETNLHNLMEESTLNTVQTLALYGLLVGAIIAWVIGRASESPVVQIYTLDSSQLFLVVIVVASGIFLHLEFSESLLSLFVSAYVWTVYRRQLQLYRRPLTA